MLGKNIQALREEYRFSQVELADQLHVSKQSVSNWENGNIQPSIEMLERLADCFSVSADFLLGRTNTRVLDVTGLEPLEITHIQLLIEDIRQARQRETTLDPKQKP